MIQFEQIHEVADHNEEYLMYLLPKAEKDGNELHCANVMGDKGSAFSYNLKSGLWSCFATGTTGCGVLDLICTREGCTPAEAADIINADLNYAHNMVERNKQEQVVRKKEYVIAPQQSFPKYYYTKDGECLDFTARWSYRNAAGQVVAYDCRIDVPDEPKTIMHFLYNRNGDRWYECMVPENRYLYNLDKLTKNPDASVMLVEGCKTADAVQQYFPSYIATTWQGKPSTYRHTDWRPLYGRKVIIIPDADDAGRKAAEAIAQHLTDHGTIVRVVNTEQMEYVKKGWDLADALEGGMEPKDLIKFIQDNIYEYVSSGATKDKIIDPEVIIKENKPKITYDDTHFRALGVLGDSHYYYKKQTSQIIEFKPAYYDAKHLINLAPLAWWQMQYPNRKEGVDWQAATDDLCRLQEKIGIFDNTKIRGRGAWFDNGKTVLHLGNVLYVNGKLIDIDDFDSEYFYEKAPSLAVKVQTSLPRADAANLLKLCRMARWENKAHGDILAGWLFSALVCGAMPFRSHLYLIGAAGTGKSWIIGNIVKHVMGNIALYVSSKSTEAGIRDQLGGDIRPVVFDESEAENNISDKLRLQAVFDLARNASSEKSDAIVKFGAKYVCRSAFLFASINSSMSKTADLSRTAFIKLANAPEKKSAEVKAQDNENFRALEAHASRLLTDEYCRCLLSRAISLVPILRKSHQVIADVAAKEFGSRRLGDQMAMIISGIWGLQSDNIISEPQARELINYTCMQQEKQDADDQTQEERCLDHILFSTVEVQTKSGIKKYMLNLLVAVMNGSEIVDGLDDTAVTQDLSSKGVCLGNIGERQYMFLSLKKSALPSKLFKATEWEFGWQDALLRIDDVQKTGNKRFGSTLVSRAIAVPLNYVIKDSASVLS